MLLDDHASHNVILFYTFLFSSSGQKNVFNYWQKRKSSSIPRSTIVTPFPPLTEPVPGLPKAVYSDAKEENQQTEITTLPNGLRIASENRFGQFCTVGGTCFLYYKPIHVFIIL